MRNHTYMHYNLGFVILHTYSDAATVMSSNIFNDSTKTVVQFVYFINSGFDYFCSLTGSTTYSLDGGREGFFISVYTRPWWERKGAVGRMLLCGEQQIWDEENR